MHYSVLICTQNRCKVLPLTLEELSRQRVPAGHDWEVVVVDNGSTDDTRGSVEAYQKTYPVPLRYVLEPKLGHSFALNTGVRACRGDVVAFTDDDAYPTVDWLAQIHEALETYGADWVFGPVSPRWEGPVPAWFDERFRAPLALLDYGPDPFVATEARQTFYGVNHACRRQAIDRLGGYREDRGLLPDGTGGVGNDTDLFERALAAGMRVVYHPQVAVEHFIPAARGEKRWHRRRNWTTARGFHLFLRNNARAVPWLLGLPRYFYGLALRDAGHYLKSFFRRDPCGTFYHELRLIRFLGLFAQGLRERLGRRATA
jgi:glycosyltransferase involved in cell wall biosynthesis